MVLIFSKQFDLFSSHYFLHLMYSMLLQVRGSRSKASHEKVNINCQYSMATFSTGDRKRRPRGDRKSIEMTMHLKQTFEAAILTHLYPRSQIDIYVEVRVQTVLWNKIYIMYGNVLLSCRIPNVLHPNFKRTFVKCCQTQSRLYHSRSAIKLSGSDLEWNEISSNYSFIFTLE